MAPAFAQAAAALRNESSPARLGKVDATAQAALANEFGITSYPTLKLFRDGNRTHPLAYTGKAASPRDGHGTHHGEYLDGCWGGLGCKDGWWGLTVRGVAMSWWGLQGGDGGQVTAW